MRTVSLSLVIAAELACLAVRLPAAEPSYFREIRPILQRQCQGCHQPNLKSSNLDLTTYEGLAAGGKRGPAPALIVKYLTGEMKPQMPLGQPPLPAEQLALVRDWVAAGAKNDTPAEARETVSSDKPPVYTQPPVVTALAFSPDGKTLAVSGNREILLHTLDGSAPPKRLSGLSERILSLAFSKDGSLLAAGGGTSGPLRRDSVVGRRIRQTAPLAGADRRYGLRRFALARTERAWRPDAPTTRCASWIRRAGRNSTRWARTRIGCWAPYSAWTASASSPWGAIARPNSPMPRPARSRKTSTCCAAN